MIILNKETYTSKYELWPKILVKSKLKATNNENYKLESESNYYNYDNVNF